MAGIWPTELGLVEQKDKLWSMELWALQPEFYKKIKKNTCKIKLSYEANIELKLTELRWAASDGVKIHEDVLF